MKRIIISIIALGLVACSSGDGNESSKSNNIPDDVPVIVVQSTVTDAVRVQFHIDQTDVVVRELKLDPSASIDGKDIEVVGQVTSTKADGGVLQEYFYYSSGSFPQRADDSSEISTFFIEQGSLDFEKSFRVNDVDTNRLKEALAKQAYFDLYRCREAELNSYLAARQLGFEGDFFFAAAGTSLVRQSSNYQLSLVVSRDSDEYLGFSFVKHESLETLSRAQNTVPSLLINIPEDRLVANTINPPVSGRNKVFRQVCDRYYGDLFANGEEPNGSSKVQQNIYLPIYDQDYEQKVGTFDDPKKPLPRALVNETEIASRNMANSHRVEKHVLNHKFFNEERFPLEKIDYQNDELFLKIKGENQ